VVEAIRSVAPAVDAGVLAFVESPQPEIGDFLVGLLNGLAALDRRLLLVLDD